MPLASFRISTESDALNAFLQEKLVPFIEGDDQDLVVSAVSTYDRLLVHGSSQVMFTFYNA